MTKEEIYEEKVECMNAVQQAINAARDKHGLWGKYHKQKEHSCLVPFPICRKLLKILQKSIDQEQDYEGLKIIIMKAGQARDLALKNHMVGEFSPVDPLHFIDEEGRKLYGLLTDVMGEAYEIMNRR